MEKASKIYICEQILNKFPIPEWEEIKCIVGSHLFEENEVQINQQLREEYDLLLSISKEVLTKKEKAFQFSHANLKECNFLIDEIKLILNEIKTVIFNQKSEELKINYQPLLQFSPSLNKIINYKKLKLYLDLRLVKEQDLPRQFL